MPRSSPMKRPGCTMLVTRSARTSVAQSRSSRMLFGAPQALSNPTTSETTAAVARNGRNSRHGDMPAAFITINSESVESLLSTWPTEITMRDRRDHEHEEGNDQAGDAEKDEDRLTAVGHQVDVAQRLRDPDHCRQTDKHQQERTERGAKNILADRPHRPAPSPVFAPPGRARNTPRAIRSDPARFPRTNPSLWINSQSGLAVAKLLKMRWKTLMRQQDLHDLWPIGTVPAERMVNGRWNPTPPRRSRSTPTLGLAPAAVAGPYEIRPARPYSPKIGNRSHVRSPQARFCPLRLPAKGVLVVFCNSELKFGPATAQAAASTGRSDPPRGRGRPFHRQGRVGPRPSWRRDGLKVSRLIVARDRQGRRTEGAGRGQARRRRHGPGAGARIRGRRFSPRPPTGALKPGGRRRSRARRDAARL